MYIYVLLSGFSQLCILACLGLILALPTVTHLRFVIWLVLDLAISFSYGVKNARATGNALDACDGGETRANQGPGV